MNINADSDKQPLGVLPSDIFVSAFKYSGIGMALVRLNGNWIEVNNAVTQITEYTREELLEMTFQDITYPDDLATDLEHVQKLIAGELDTYSLEKRYITKSRKVVWVLLTVSVVRQTGQPQFFISQITDIDKEKELERQLHFKVGELEATRQTLDAKIKQLEHLNYTLAHNLRGPVRNIQMLSEALLSAHDPSVAANELTGALSEQEGLKLIAKSAAKLSENLDQLLAMTSIRQNSELHFQDCDLLSIINGILHSLSAAIYEKHVSIRLSLKERVIRAPAVYLESILYNLISNAIKYIDPHRLPVVEIDSEVMDGRKLIRVTDNGIGIDLAAHRNKLFQMNQTFHTGYDSKGVGLFLTKAQADAIGATLDVTSEPGSGSSFTIMF